MGTTQAPLWEVRTWWWQWPWREGEGQWREGEGQWREGEGQWREGEGQRSEAGVWFHAPARAEVHGGSCAYKGRRNVDTAVPDADNYYTFALKALGLLVSAPM